MGETLDVFVDRYDLLQILVLSVAEDWIVDNYAIDRGIVIRVNETVFEKFAIDFTEIKSKATVNVLMKFSAVSYPKRQQIQNQQTCSLFNTRLARPLCIHPSSGICAREKADQQRLASDLT